MKSDPLDDAYLSGRMESASLSIIKRSAENDLGFVLIAEFALSCTEEDVREFQKMGVDVTLQHRTHLTTHTIYKTIRGIKKCYKFSDTVSYIRPTNPQKKALLSRLRFRMPINEKRRKLMLRLLECKELEFPLLQKERALRGKGLSKKDVSKISRIHKEYECIFDEYENGNMPIK